MCDETHNRVVKDEFAKLPGVKRTVPGDCYCLDCGEQLPAWWNRGKPIPCEGANASAPSTEPVEKAIDAAIAAIPYPHPDTTK